MLYLGRLEAGQALARTLRHLDLGACVVAGIPCGGSVVAGPIAEFLDAPLTVVHARKLSSPQAPEYAFGAMDEDGQAVLDYRSVVTLGLGEAEVERIKAATALAIARRVGLYPGPRLLDLLPGRTAVLVDDGLATGLTMQAAIGYAQRHGAEATVVAVPCASERAAYEMKSLLQREADRFICPEVRSEFRAVGECYRDFGQVADEEVVEILRRAGALHSTASS